MVAVRVRSLLPIEVVLFLGPVCLDLTSMDHHDLLRQRLFQRMVLDLALAPRPYRVLYRRACQVV